MEFSDNDDNYYFLNPGMPEVMDYIRKIVVDIVKRYNVDGIHFDRVRYPGPSYSHDPISKSRFEGEGNPDGLSWQDWQRQQITVCLERIYAEVMSINPKIKVTAAVWGIYNKNEIPGYSRFSSGYHDYYQDSLQWAEEGAVDALIPMIYWAMNDTQKPDYDELLDYFSSKVTKRHLYGGMTVWNQPKSVIDAIKHTRRLKEEGNVIFSWSKLLSQNELPVLKSEVYPQQIETPDMLWKNYSTRGIIFGRVLKSGDGSPIVDALVKVADSDKQRVSSADGSFALLELPTGNVTLQIKKDRVGETTVESTVEAGKVAEVIINL
jgi:uncharacterized lipoprotein YddW (UPF0748 family)